MHRVLGDRRAIMILLGPALLFYTLIMLVPTVWSLGYSFTKGNSIDGFTGNGLANFTRLLSDQAVHDALWFTVKYAILVTVGQVIAGYLLALLHVFFLKKASALIRTLVFFPVVLPTVAVGLLFQKFFQVAPQTGPVNSLLNTFGLESIDFFGSAGSAFWVLVSMDIWRSMGFYAVLLFAGSLVKTMPETRCSR
ncbi:Sugar ABC transporter permease OS=Streptomyces cyaneofuscatus OX=66883 GN=G3I52_03475 PE=3 SV=1 [Streptomyces cyaneofuscatus]